MHTSTTSSKSSTTMRECSKLKWMQFTVCCRQHARSCNEGNAIASPHSIFRTRRQRIHRTFVVARAKAFKSSQFYCFRFAHKVFARVAYRENSNSWFEFAAANIATAPQVIVTLASFTSWFSRWFQLIYLFDWLRTTSPSRPKRIVSQRSKLPTLTAACVRHSEILGGDTTNRRYRLLTNNSVIRNQLEHHVSILLVQTLPWGKPVGGVSSPNMSMATRFRSHWVSPLPIFPNESFLLLHSFDKSS